jgi:hypothetical protein
MPERVTLDLPLPIHLALYAVFKLPISTRRDGLASNQLHWLANANVQKLSRAHAKRLYLALITVGFGAHIPLDNRQRILGGK